MPLMTASESKAIGWEGATITTYPTLEQIEEADRLQLARWYRFLRSPDPETVEPDLLVQITSRLQETYPIIGAC